MNYLITKIQLFLIINKREVDIAIRVLFYLIFVQPDLLDILTSCSPTPKDDEGLAACLDAQKLAIDDLNKNNAYKSWLSQKAQTMGSSGMEGDKGSATVIRDNKAYTVQVGRVSDEDGTFRLVSDCVRGNLKKDKDC